MLPLLPLLLIVWLPGQQARREQRALVFPDPLESETKVQVLFGLGLPMEGDVAMTLGYVLKCNYNLPHNASALGAAPRGGAAAAAMASRWSVYRLLERLLGKSCLLRAVCEAGEAPFARLGLVGQLLQALLTPSLTAEEYEAYADREYRAAEARGLSSGCRCFERDCPRSPLGRLSVLL